VRAADEPRRPWGERTHRQRLATYSFFLVFSGVCSVLWGTYTVEFDRGIAQYGEIAFASGLVVFAVKLTREMRS